MLRRASLAILMTLLFTTLAFPKWKPEEQEYLDDQFKTLQDQIQGLKKQNEALAEQLAQMQRNQAAFQSAMLTEQKKLDELEQLIASLRLGNEENFAGVKTAISKLQDEQAKSFNDLIGRNTQTAATSATIPAPAPAVKGYVTAVKGDVVTVDLGVSQGIHVGSKLQVFKPTDLNTPVGEIEVTDTTDSGTSHARVVSLTPGVKVDFSDQVRLEP
ncbi:MAG: hypothetical protein ACM3NO_00645 [Deltaproteobacteria bacterium]